MIKTLRKITLGAVIALAVVCMGIFAAACDKNDDGGEAYVITVLYPNGSAVDGQTEGTGGVIGDGEQGTFVMVQLCDADNEEHCYTQLRLGADGKLSIPASELEEALSGVNNFAVHLNGLPEGYGYDDNYKVSKTNKEVTITLKLK
ncbi:MAG: hypothetical protein K2I30_07015 [Clostridia bacterium]|nr:hypothetical protein [Clostridia bacterium]